MTARRVDLARRKDERGLLLTDLALNDDGSLRIGWFDTGPYAKEHRRGDVEHDVVINADAVPLLCFALLKNRLAGDLSAIQTIKQLCDEIGIRYNETGWN